MQSAYSFPATTQHIVIKNPNEDDGVDFSSLSETDALFVNTEEVGDTVELKYDGNLLATVTKSDYGSYTVVDSGGKLFLTN